MSLLHNIKTAIGASFAGKGVTWEGFAPVDSYGVQGIGALDDGIRFIVNDGAGLGEWGGSPWDSSAVFPCLKFYSRGLAQSPLRLVKVAKDGKIEPVTDPRAGLLDNPCPEYDGVALRKALALSYALDGNAYALIGRDGLRQPNEILYVPHTQMRPVAEKETGRLSHYEQRVKNKWVRIETADVIHVRDGIDLGNPLLGMSRWRAMITEVLTDQDAARASHYIMRRLGVVPYALSLTDGPNDEPLTPEEAELVKAKLEDATGIRNSGRPPVIGRKAQVLKLGATPEELVLDKVRSIPTERVCAVFEIDPMVVYLPSDNKTFSNYAEAREAGTEGATLPMQTSFEGGFNAKLLTNIDRGRGYAWRFDNSGVRELQEDKDKLHARTREDYVAGLCSLEEGQQITGYDGHGTFYSVSAAPAVPKSVQALAMKRATEDARRG